MTDRFQDIMRALLTVLLLGIAGTAAGQPALNQLAPPASARSTVSPQAMPAPSVQAPATPADPRVNTAEITSRVNQELGVDLEATIAGWQRELDRLESDLRRPHQRYAELNNFRDEVQRIRSGIEDFWNRLQPRLVAAKAQVCWGRLPPLANHRSLNR